MAPVIRMACVLALLGFAIGLPLLTGAARPALTSSWPR